MTFNDTGPGFHYALEPLLEDGNGQPTADQVGPFTYTFHNFFHPFVAEMIQQLNHTSVRGLLDPDFQAKLTRDIFPGLFTIFQDPRFKVQSQKEINDVSANGAYANY